MASNIGQLQTQASLNDGKKIWKADSLSVGQKLITSMIYLCIILNLPLLSKISLGD